MFACFRKPFSMLRYEGKSLYVNLSWHIRKEIVYGWYLCFNQGLVNCVVDDQLEGLEAVAAKEDLRHVDNMNTDLSIDSSQFDTKMTVYREEGENEDTTKTSINESSQQAVLHTSSRSSTNDKLHSMAKKVA